MRVRRLTRRWIANLRTSRQKATDEPRAIPRPRRWQQAVARRRPAGARLAGPAALRHVRGVHDAGDRGRVPIRRPWRRARRTPGSRAARSTATTRRNRVGLARIGTARYEHRRSSGGARWESLCRHGPTACSTFIRSARDEETRRSSFSRWHDHAGGRRRSGRRDEGCGCRAASRFFANFWRVNRSLHRTSHGANPRASRLRGVLTPVSWLAATVYCTSQKSLAEHRRLPGPRPVAVGVVAVVDPRPVGYIDVEVDDGQAATGALATGIDVVARAKRPTSGDPHPPTSCRPCHRARGS
jgi:hypothetical protein